MGEDHIARARFLGRATAKGARPTNRDSREVKGLSRCRLERVRAFILQNLDKPITPAMLADAAALSPYHFARSFKAAVGVPPMRYVWQTRIDCAKDLIKANPDASLLSIALSCGFACHSHFTDMFKRVVGEAPSSWRSSLHLITLSIAAWLAGIASAVS